MSALRWLVWLVLAAGLVWWLAFSPQFRLTDISLIGTDAVAAKAFAQTLRGANIFRLNSVAIESGLKKSYPPIARAQLVRGLPRSLKIDVTLRQARLRWRVGETVAIVDETGAVFDQGETTAYGDLPLVTDTTQIPVSRDAPVASPAFIAFVTALSNQADAYLHTSMRLYEVGATTLQVDGFFMGERRVRFTLARPVEAQLADAGLIFAAHGDAQIIDVRVAGWGYWK